ncbi:MAG: 5-formyltetrahydrofolate cyclo-ligase [Clostridiales bacterium]|nr:5-formyltetrahydrofolate cyclo-ligase [Clostridiales bacterium]
MDDKKIIRDKIRAMRRDVDPEDAAYAADLLSELFFEIPDERLRRVLSGGTVALYMPFDGEIDVIPLARKLLSQGVTTVFPVIVGDRMIFRAADPGKKELFAEGRYGIAEPIPDLPELTPDLVIVPAVAFNEEGVRLGMGAGYYDRYYKAHQEAVYVGVCYDMQVTSDLPFDEDDMAADILLPIDVKYDEDDEEDIGE